MNVTSKSLTNQLQAGIAKAGKYRVLLFSLFVLSAYGYMAYQITMLSTAVPSEEIVTSELRNVRPRQIDEATVTQLQNLQDNNVNVRALFDEARNNPFQE